MDEEKNLPEEKPAKKDMRQNRSPNGALGFRVAAILVVLYCLFQVIRGYVQGGPDAPSLGLLLVAIGLLGGGSIIMAVMSYRQWKDATKKDEPEEAEAAPESEETTEETED